MAISRQWYTRGNIPCPDASTAELVAKSLLYLFVGVRCGWVSTGTVGPEGARPASADWEVAGSCDSVTAGMDGPGTNRIGPTFDASKWVRATAGNPHSWIVISKPGGFFLCLDWSAAANTGVSLFASKNAFTGGSTTARPTSTGEVTVIGNAVFNNGAIANHNVHDASDADGNFYFHAGQVSSGRANLEIWGSVAAEARGGDTGNFFTAYGYANSSRGPTFSTMAIATAGRNWNNTATHTGLGADIYAGGSGWAGTNEANAVDGKFDSLPFYIISRTAGAAGIRGRWPDLAMVGAAPVGASEPTTGTQERAVFGDFLVPCSVVPTL